MGAASELRDTELRVQRARGEYGAELQSNDERHRSTLSTDQLQEEALERENTQLKSFLAQQSCSSAGLSNLHNKLENHIQRLQRHTEELRTNLHDASGAS